MSRNITANLSPPGLTFALIRKLTPGEKPVVFDGLAQLARRIHRERGEDALQLRPERLRWRGETLQVVEIYAEEQLANQVRFLGYAFIGDRPWEVLQATLAATGPAAEAWPEAA